VALGLDAAPPPDVIDSQADRPEAGAGAACLQDKKDDADPDDKPAAKSADGKKSAGTKKSTPKARKPRPQKRVQRFTVEQGVYASDDGVTDLTQRLQAATKDGLLVVFVEKALSEDKKQQKSGSLFLRIQADGDTVEQKIAHRQFYFLDARDPAKFSPKGLVILDAFYGSGLWGEDKMVDVKKLLSDKISNNEIDVPVKDLVEPIPDPAAGLSKALIVRFAVNGVPLVVMFEEHETVKLSLR
jgi:hypothetical protein